MSETPTTTTPRKSIAIHLQFVLPCFWVPLRSEEREFLSVLLACVIAVHLPFVLQDASHLYRSTFGKLLVVVVTGMFPILHCGEKPRWECSYLRETEVQRRRGTTSPDPEKIPEALRGPLGGFPVGIPRQEKTLRASKGQFSSERLSEDNSTSGVAPPLFFKATPWERDKGGVASAPLSREK